MDKNLSALKPALVWKHFAEIVRIPRPSSHEEKIRRYILDFARAQGLESKEDAAHNVYVRKPASKGMEDRKGVILQAHLDMVPQKNNDKKGVVVCNIGDASLGCGPVYEAMNFSAMDQFKTLWEEGRKGGLPIIFNGSTTQSS